MGKFSLSARQQAGRLLKISKKGNNTRPGTRLTSPHHATPYLTLPRLTSPCVTLHLALPYIPSRCTSHHSLPCQILHLASPCVASPQNPSLSPQHKSNFILLHTMFCIATHLVTFHLTICLVSCLVSPHVSLHVSFCRTSCHMPRYASPRHTPQAHRFLAHKF